jgi:transposase
VSKWLERVDDIEVLRKAALLLQAENERLASELAQALRDRLRAEGRDPEGAQLALIALEQQLDAMRARIFGASTTEKRGAGRDATPKPKTGHGPRTQTALPIEEVRHELDEADRACRVCGGRLEEWAGQDETSEQVDIVTRRFVIKRHVRVKYRCRCGGCVETAPLPPRLVPGGRYSTDFAIEVAVGKCLDHLPLERQVRIMAREGLYPYDDRPERAFLRVQDDDVSALSAGDGSGGGFQRSGSSSSSSSSFVLSMRSRTPAR